MIARLMSAVALLAAVVFGQAPSAVEIRGVVLEVGTNLPVSEANVTAQLETHETGAPPKFADAGAATTDLQGAFRFRLDKPGTYYVRVHKDGYTDDGRNPMRRTPSNQATVTVDKDAPMGEVRLLLARPASLSGRVVDEETGEPLRGFLVHPMSLLYANGEPAYIHAGTPATDEDGRFVTTGLRAGNYVVEVGPQSLVKEQLLEKFSDEDRKTIDSDYQRSYWPGGGPLDLALPVQVVAGGSANVGTIKARKASFYRVHLSIPAGGCAAGDKVSISTIMLQYLGADGGGQAVCGKDYLLRNFQPGAYQMYLLGSGTGENRMRVILPVEVTNKNLELTVPLGRGVDVDGRVAVAEGVSNRPPMEKIRITLRTAGDLQFADEGLPAVPDVEGRFRFTNRPLARGQLSIAGLPANYCVREIRYNGVSAPDGTVIFNGNAMAHSLEIVVDDKPASITGTAVDGDTPVSKAQVILVRWPASREDIFLSVKRAAGDEKGKFQFTSLAPGEYRLLAVPEVSAEKLDEPRVLERILRSAARVELTAGVRETLTLKVTDPAR